MSSITLCKHNESFIRIEAERSILQEISERYTFFAQNYRFMPAYKHGVWDGKIRLFNLNTCLLPAGLRDDLLKFATDNNYTIIGNERFIHESISTDDINEFVSLLKIPYELRDYQFNSIQRIVIDNRVTLISPTGSGKSLMIYATALWSLNKNHRILIVVPTTSLVEQLFNDFKDYSKQNGFDVEANCHKIYSGHDKNTNKPIIISTWQSIFNLNKSWFEKFQTLIVDEAHLAKAKSLSKISESCVNCVTRIGTTGTLDGSQINELMLVGMFGPVYRATTTKQLIDNDTLSKIAVNLIKIDYDKDTSKDFSKLVSSYPEEIQYITSFNKRNQFIAKLALVQKKNTLLLFNYVETHGKPLFELIKAKNKDPNRKIYFISGEIETAYREEVRNEIENQTNAILVASSGTFSTGINIRNLHNIIFASPTKSQIRVLQSIGRGLRKHGNDSLLNIFDIVDDFSCGKKKQNFALKHGIARMKIYMKEQFPIESHAINFG